MRKNILLSLSILAALTAATGCGGGTKTAETEETEKILVKTLPATIEEVDVTVEFTSNIQAYKENNISPSLAVRIDQILVDVGQNVRRGQLLVKMDPSQFNQANVQLSNLESDFERMNSVFQAGGISASDLDQARTQLNVLQDQVENLKTNIELRSPIDGVVTARNYDPGDLYNGTPILQVMQINTLKVAVDISEQYFPDVKMGMPASIRVDMYPDRTFDGKVSLIYPSVDPNSRTFKVEITIPNPKGELRPGMFSRTTLKFGTRPGVMVEDLSVQKQIGSNDKYIYVVKDGEAERRIVTTGIQSGNRINILSGVEEGEQVVTAGMAKLMNGSEVEVVND